jgi:hypothetical protein
VWRHIAQSAAGEHHSASGAACQDFCLAAVLGEGPTAALAACTADGAGSSSYSGAGSRAACEAFMQAAAGHVASHRNFDAIEADDLLAWLDAARDAVFSQAESAGRSPRDYATTRRSAFLQIGDGAMIARRHGPVGVVLWPQSGEYINTTNFLTAPDYREVAQTCLVDHGFTDLAMLTDGLAPLALRFDGLTAHAPFFNPLFQTLRNSQDVAALNEELRQFLQSPPIRNKTDDDATLVVASLIADAHGTPD